MWDAGEKVKTGGKPQTKSKLSQQTHEALSQQESKSAVSQWSDLKLKDIEVERDNHKINSVHMGAGSNKLQPVLSVVRECTGPLVMWEEASGWLGLGEGVTFLGVLLKEGTMACF